MSANLIHYVNYQQIPCKEVQFRRSPGLAPEPGYVIVDYSDLKALKLQSDAIPWRGTSESKEDPGGISIHVWHKLKGTATIADSPKSFRPAGSGLRLYGPLVMTTVADRGGGGDSITYSDIYVDNAAEVSQDLAEARAHARGEIRIELTDIRKFYPYYGPLIGRINCHLRSGRWDPTTVKRPGNRRATGTTTETEFKGEPWSFVDVMSYLFSQLPGSPRVSFRDLKFGPPEEIDQIGAPAMSVIQGILDDCRIVAQMLPHGNYSLARKTAKYLSPGEVATAGAKGKGGKSTPEWISYETKSVTQIDVPTAVMVLGRPRVRRRTAPYVPVFQDLDGQTYRLFEIDKVWDGYDIDKVNRQASKGTEKNFADVPPRPPRRPLDIAIREGLLAGEKLRGFTDFEKTRDLHYRRRDIMRTQAYRLYAPAALFTSQSPRNKKGALQMLDPDSDWIEFLPLGSAPFMASQLADSLELGVERKPVRKGEIALVPPVVRAYRLGSVLEIDPKAATAMLDAAIGKAETDYNAHIKSQIERKAAERGELIGPALKAEEELRKNPGLEPVTILGIDTGRLNRGGEIFTSARAAMEKTKELVSKHVAAKIKLELLDLELDELFKMEKEALAKIDIWKRRRGEILVAIREEGGVHVAQSQMPYGIAPQSSYHLDPQTGLLGFDELACVIDPPILHDPNSGRVMGDGLVTVTFGFESHWNEPSDYTNVIFGRDEKGGIGVIGVSGTSPVKPAIVHDNDLVMYEDDRGIPLNMAACIDQASRKGAHKLQGDQTTEGFETKFSGFVEATLAPSVDAIQHIWGGDERAYTYVAVNAPNWVGPAGPAATPKSVDAATPARQAAKRAWMAGG